MVKDKIAILDVDSMAFAIGWGNKIPDGQGGYLRDEKGRLIYEDKTEDELIECANRVIIDILINTESTHYIGFIKGFKTANHRYSVKSDYKSKRPKESPKWWDFVKKYLIENFNIHQVDYIEVDDAVNITRLNVSNSFVVAIDKDLLQLSGTHYNWRKNEWITTSKEEENRLFWVDMIAGQSGDGVKCLPGKGEAYANKTDCTPESTLKEYIDFYGEYNGINEYYKNYTCLKLLESYDGFLVPEIKPVFKPKEESDIKWMNNL